MIRIDPEFKTLIPPLTPDERSGLEESILKYGCRDALVVWGDILIDGHNRYEICTKHGIGYDTVSMEFGSRDDVKIWIIKNQLARRNLPPFVALELLGKLEGVIAKQAKERQRCGQGGVLLVQTFEQASEVQPDPMKNKTAYKIGEIAGVSHETVRKAQVVIEKAPEEVKEKLRSGEMTINKAYTDIKIKENKQEQERKKATNPTPPVGKYKTIVIDPPWEMKKIPRDVRPNQNGFDYPTMSLEEIAAFALPIDEEAHVYMWTTQKYLPAAFDILKAWGVKYIFTMTWHKDGGFQPVGLPQYNSEFVLFGRVGGLKFDDTKAFNTCFNGKRREHSRKPDEFYDIVRRVSPEPRIDIFARETRDGFDVWGNETGVF